jgi:hypothetical protein
MSTIEAAVHMWLEAGAMSGPPEQRHQVELAGDTVLFFDAASRRAERVWIMPPRGEGVERPLTHRGHSHGQWGDIWRLGLPTLAMGGVEYPGRILHFERRTGQDRVYYVLEVAEPESSRAAWWKRLSERDGASGTTPGAEGRLYGYW